MTTIAWDGKTLATDRMAVCGATKRMVRKLFDCGAYWYGGAGNFDDVHRVAAWLKAGADAANPLVLEEGSVLGIAVRKCDAESYLVEGKHVVLCVFRKVPEATGSGHEYARSAMAFGKTAVQAVTFAARFDAYTGMGVDSVRIRPTKR